MFIKKFLTPKQKANKVGRPKLAKSNIVKAAKIEVALSFVLCATIVLSGTSVLTGKSPLELLGLNGQSGFLGNVFSSDTMELPKIDGILIEPETSENIISKEGSMNLTTTFDKSYYGYYTKFFQFSITNSKVTQVKKTSGVLIGSSTLLNMPGGKSHRVIYKPTGDYVYGEWRVYADKDGVNELSEYRTQTKLYKVVSNYEAKQDYKPYIKYIIKGNYSYEDIVDYNYGFSIRFKTKIIVEFPYIGLPLRQEGEQPVASSPKIYVKFLHNVINNGIVMTDKIGMFGTDRKPIELTGIGRKEFPKSTSLTKLDINPNPIDTHNIGDYTYGEWRVYSDEECKNELVKYRTPTDIIYVSKEIPKIAKPIINYTMKERYNYIFYPEHTLRYSGAGAKSVYDIDGFEVYEITENIPNSAEIIAKYVSKINPLKFNVEDKATLVLKPGIHKIVVRTYRTVNNGKKYYSKYSDPIEINNKIKPPKLQYEKVSEGKYKIFINKEAYEFDYNSNGAIEKSDYLIDGFDLFRESYEIYGPLYFFTAFNKDGRILGLRIDYNTEISSNNIHDPGIYNFKAKAFIVINNKKYYSDYSNFIEIWK